MVKLRLADFYYGSVLSFLFFNQIKPALVEMSDDRQIYDITTNNGNYRLYLKYCAKPRIVKKEDYDSWVFSFNPDDITEIKETLSKSNNLVLLLICGREKLVNSEIVAIENENIKKIIIEYKKTSISISRLKNEQAYRIRIGGSRKDALQIKSNSLEHLIT